MVDLADVRPLSELQLLPHVAEPVAAHVDYLPPDLDYYMDCSVMFGHCGLDTEYYVRHIHPAPAMLIDGISSRPANQSTLFSRERSHLNSLANSALLLEDNYIGWRMTANSTNRAAPAMHTMIMWQTQLNELVSDSALGLVNRGCTTLSGSTLLRLPETSLYRGMSVLKRSLVRSLSDLAGVTNSALLGSYHTYSNLVARPAFVPHCPSPKFPLRKSQLRTKRSILKRSIKMLSHLIGHDATRMFINENFIEIEGRLCLYVIRRNSFDVNYGGSSLELWSKDTRELIANVCIYTSQVPLLDHVASIVLHIKAGEEEDILRIGNIFKVNWAIISRHPEIFRFCPPQQRKIVLNDQSRTVNLTNGERRTFPFGMEESNAIPDRTARRDALALELHEHVRSNFGQAVFDAATTQHNRLVDVCGLRS